MRKSGPRRDLMERELLERAAEIFAARGFANTTLQDIADAAKVGRTTLYHYFKSKDEFLTALVEDVTIQGSRRMRAIRLKSDVTASERLREAVLGHLDWLLARPNRFKVLVRDEHTLPPEILRRHEAAKRDLLAEFSAIIQGGIDAGEFHDGPPRVLALSIIGMCNWSVWWFTPKGAMTSAQLGEMMAEMAVRAVRRAEPFNGGRTAKTTLREIRTSLAELERLIESER
jgi:AcrR family transcriptional regulator